jgi:hypothetical protein
MEATGKMSQPKIRTDCICPPIPIRSFDWIAYIDGREENERALAERRKLPLPIESKRSTTLGIIENAAALTTAITANTARALIGL